MFRKLLLLYFILIIAPSYTVDPVINKKIQNKIDVIANDSADVIITLAKDTKLQTTIYHANELLDELIYMLKSGNILTTHNLIKNSQNIKKNSCC